jgi:acetyl esterase
MRTSNDPGKFRFRLLRKQFFENSFRFMAWTKEFSDYQQAARKRCKLHQDIAYLSDGKKAHRLDILRPDVSGRNLPVMIYIHGGGFTMCSKETHGGIALAYADHGHVVFNINYRLSPKYKFPAALEDVGHAFAWIVKNARSYGGDPEQMVVSGESAGGNLTLALAICCCFKRQEPEARMIWDIGVAPKIIMVMCGMLQVSAPYRLKKLCPPINPFSKALDLTIARDVARAYLGRTYRTPDPDRMLADPLWVMESDAKPSRTFPMTYAMCGTHDILLDDTMRLEKSLVQKGLPHVVRYFPKQGHAFHLLGLSPQAKIFWRENLSFLKKEIKNNLASGRWIR